MCKNILPNSLLEEEVWWEMFLHEQLGHFGQDFREVSIDFGRIVSFSVEHLTPVSKSFLNFIKS